MSETTTLQNRIESALNGAKERIKLEQQSMLQDHLVRQKLLKEYEAVQEKIVGIARPKLDLLAKKAGDRAVIMPEVVGSRRTVKFEFKSAKAYITLTFSVAPDRSLKNAVVEFDLRVIPVLWKYESHSEFSSPVATFDSEGLAAWLDDRIVTFVELVIHIHEDVIFDREEQVEDPVAGVKFPKFAAGATLEHNGQTHFFIDNTTRAAYADQKGIKLN